jgi:hypothetical protein
MVVPFCISQKNVIREHFYSTTHLRCMADIRECTMKMWPEGVHNSGGFGGSALEIHVEVEDHVSDWMSAR